MSVCSETLHPLVPVGKQGTSVSGQKRSEARELQILSQVQQSLEAAASVAEVMAVRNQAQAIRTYARRAERGRRILVQAAVLRVRAERALGEALRRLPLAKGSPGNQYTGRLGPATRPSDQIYLRELGVSDADSSRSQRIAAIPVSDFEEYLSKKCSTNEEPTVAGALRLARESQPISSGPKPTAMGHLRGGLSRLISSGKQYSTIFADPLWPVGSGDDRRLRDRFVAALANESVERVACRASHLHMVVANEFLADGVKVLEAWGFRYHSSMMCVSVRRMCHPLGFQPCHDAILLGVRGELPFARWQGRRWMDVEDGAILNRMNLVEFVEHTSPGPFLELLGRGFTGRYEWTSCGSF